MVNFVVYCLQALTVNGAEKSLAQTALFTRHPAMKGWPTGHGKVSRDNVGACKGLNIIYKHVIPEKVL